MILQVEVPNEAVEPLITEAIKMGFTRVNPRVRWGDTERRHAVKYCSVRRSRRWRSRPASMTFHSEEPNGEDGRFRR